MISGANYVYHFAGQADIGKGFAAPQETIAANVMGTTYVLEACRAFSVDRFLFASTIYVYSELGGFYKASKQACEILIEEYQKNFGIPYTIFRYGSLYGPRADSRNFIYRILQQALCEKTIKMGYGGEEKRDYIHVWDAARMSIDLLDPRYENTRVMLTGYQQMTRHDLAHMISEILGGDIAVEESLEEATKNQGHYTFTPYAFRPKVSKKMVCDAYVDLGQGLLSCLEEIYEKKNPSKN